VSRATWWQAGRNSTTGLWSRASGFQRKLLDHLLGDQVQRGDDQGLHLIQEAQLLIARLLVRADLVPEQPSQVQDRGITVALHGPGTLQLPSRDLFADDLGEGLDALCLNSSVHASSKTHRLPQVQENNHENVVLSIASTS